MKARNIGGGIILALLIVAITVGKHYLPSSEKRVDASLVSVRNAVYADERFKAVWVGRSPPGHPPRVLIHGAIGVVEHEETLRALVRASAPKLKENEVLIAVDVVDMTFLDLISRESLRPTISNPDLEFLRDTLEEIGRLPESSPAESPPASDRGP